jgi:hypothetical protein
MEKIALKHVVSQQLRSRLALAGIRFTRHHNAIVTLFAVVRLHQDGLVLERPGKLDRFISYERLRMGQLINVLAGHGTTSQARLAEFLTEELTMVSMQGGATTASSNNTALPSSLS